MIKITFCTLLYNTSLTSSYMGFVGLFVCLDFMAYQSSQVI